MNDQTDILQELLDIEELKRLKATYFRTLDTQRWDEWGQVFATDAVLEIPGTDVVNGREAIVAAVSKALTGATTVHHGHMPELRLTGRNTATGIWAMFDYVEWPQAADGTRAGINGFGHYHDDYIREDGEWRISRLRLDRLRVDAL